MLSQEWISLKGSLPAHRPTKYFPFTPLVLEDNLFKEDVEVMPQGSEAEEFHCYLTELNFDLAGFVGYLVRLESKADDVSTASFHVVKNQPKCQFQYVESRNRYLRDFVEDDGKAAATVGSYFDGTSHSVGVSSLGLDKSSWTNTMSGAKRDLSQLNVQNLKMLSQKTLTPRGSQYELATRKTFESHAIKNAPNAKTIAPSKPGDETPIKDNLSSNQALRKQTTFIAALNENTSKDAPLKGMHTKYYDMLLPKYKQLSKFASGDFGIANLIEVIKGQKSYGDEIKTYRLINGIIEEIEEDNYAQMLLKEIEVPEIGIGEGQRSMAKHKEEDLKILKSRLKTKKDIQKLIAETPYPLSMTLLKPSTLVWILLLTVLLVTEYVYTWYRLNGVLDNTEILEYSFKLKQSMMTLWYSSREIFLVAGGSYTAYASTYPTLSTYTEALQSLINLKSYDGSIYLHELYSRSPGSVRLSDFVATMYLYVPGTSSFVAEDYAINQAVGIVTGRNV